MKKSLVIISFAFIFLLTMSVISASWFGDFWAKVTGKTSGPCIGSGCEKADVPSKDNEAIAGTGGSGVIIKTKAGVSSSGTRCGTPNTPVCDNAGIIKRTDGRQVRPMLGINNNKRPVARLPPTENDLPTGGERSLKGLNLTNATIGLAREKFKINFTNQTGCTNECAFAGQNVVCWLPGNLPGNQTCGNFDDDLCLEWSSCV